MSEIIEKAIARILYSKFMEHFDDIEALSQVQSSQDFKLILELEKTIESDRDSQNVDYSLVVGAWNEIYESVKDLNSSYEELISHISKEFKVIINDDFMISGTLYDHEKFFLRKLDATWSEQYKSYLLEIDKIILAFRIKLLRYSSADIQDNFFSQHHLIEQQNIKFKKSTFNSRSIYLDTNAVQVLAADRKIRSYISKSEMAFCYSSFLIEDAVNSNPVFLNSFLLDLQTITGGNMVGYMDEGLCYVNESIEDTLDRVSKYSKLTKLYESHVMNDVLKHFHLYSELRKGKELVKLISDDFIGFFSSSEKSSLAGFDKILCKFQNTIIGDFVQSGDIGEIDDYREAIIQLSSLFDFVNFETEHVKLANFKKIASSYRDRQHLEHAYICDFFVSDDIRLRNRAKVAFDILGIKTKALSINEFKSSLKANSL
ncbi:hypothetical protein I6M54_16050 [Shewanella algae]|uniref:hypothetical protein n=1 Tax=Shewanella algae TaxID=38313 RepID=UPI001AAD08A1|nr:hypothetical protein [Shewanella algae]MBO2596330.1 hypothetical protein [Shewanella algae]MBO2667688.1 hypothetical protein [Shewanella algae]